MQKSKIHLQLACVVLAFVLLAGFPCATAAQQASLSIKFEKVEDTAFPKVQAFVSVSDAQGYPVKDLQPQSFRVSEGGKPVTNFSLNRFMNTGQPLAIVLVMDTSGSMNAQPLKDSVAAAKNFAGTLAPQDQLGLVSFATTVTTQQDLTTDQQLIDSKLDGLKADGDTSLYDAMVQAIGLLKNNANRRVVVLLTDGKESGISKYNFDQVVNEAVRWKTPVYPIGFGNIDEKMLGKLAQSTGGVSQVNPDSTTLTDAFSRLLGVLREQYQFDYTSALPADNLEHALEISVDYQGGSASAAKNIVARSGQVSVTVSEPTSGQVVGGKVRIAGTAQGPAEIAGVEIRLDGQPLTTTQGSPFAYVWDASAIPPGSHTLEVSVVDKSGNQGQAQLPLTLEAAITVKLDLSDQQELSGTQKISAQVNSKAGGAQLEFFVDGQSIGQASATPYETTWDAKGVNPGPHTVRVKAVDSAGFSAEDSVKITVSLQKSSNILAIALLVLIVAAAIIIPLSLKLRRGKPAQALAPVTGPPLATGAGWPADGELMTGAGAPAAIVGAEFASFLDDAVATQTNDLLVSDGGLGETQYFLREQAGMNPGQVWALGSSDIRLGRKRAENDIPLLGLRASRHHALIRRQTEGYVIYALNPENPLTINGKTVIDQTVLCPGDVIEAGESTFKFEVKA